MRKFEFEVDLENDLVRVISDKEGMLFSVEIENGDIGMAIKKCLEYNIMHMKKVSVEEERKVMRDIKKENLK